MPSEGCHRCNWWKMETPHPVRPEGWRIAFRGTQTTRARLQPEGSNRTTPATRSKCNRSAKHIAWCAAPHRIQTLPIWRNAAASATCTCGVGCQSSPEERCAEGSSVEASSAIPIGKDWLVETTLDVAFALPKPAACDRLLRVNSAHSTINSGDFVLYGHDRPRLAALLCSLRMYDSQSGREASDDRNYGIDTLERVYGVGR
jgi:hypothetical protein